MLHLAIFGATCVATKLRDKFDEKLSGVTKPLEVQEWISDKAILPKMIF